MRPLGIREPYPGRGVRGGGYSPRLCFWGAVFVLVAAAAGICQLSGCYALHLFFSFFNFNKSTQKRPNVL